MLKNISIKGKLILSALLSIIGLGVLVLLLNSSVNTLNEFSESKSKVEELKTEMLMLRRHEKDFLLRKDLKYKDNFNKSIKNFHMTSGKLIYLLEKKNIDSSKVKELDSIIDEYQLKFMTLVNKQEHIGITPKVGLYNSLRDSVHEVQSVAKKSHNGDFLAHIYELRKEEKDFMLRKNIKYVESFKSKITKLFLSMPENESTLEIKKNLLSYKKDFMALVKAEKQIGLNSKVGIRGEMRTTVQKTELLLKEMSHELGELILHEVNSLKTQSFIISAFIVLFVLVFATVLARNIILSINAFKTGLVDFFKYLNKENTDVVFLDESSKDEIGVMAKVVNSNIIKTKSLIEQDTILIEDVKRVVTTINNGMLNGRIEKITKNESLEELKNIFNQMLEKLSDVVCSDTNKIQTGIKEFQQLNFSHRIPNATGQTSKGLNALAEIINEMLVENKSNGLTLNNSSEILLENVNILNRNSNESASALEETAIALEQITSNIVNNTQNVVMMSDYAKELNESANNGEVLAEKTTTAMNEIDTQVMAIDEAISVIDKIAFQTNILSLNAAVEAATAGEAGKGFAVVAQEVRNLAARSADAAKEIKDLVQNATTKTNDGKTIATEMIEGFSGLNNNISKTMELICNIENASKEQQKGIEQINDAIISLEQQTQENASISNKTQDVANQTNDIAKIVVKNADEKEFIGKENVQAKVLTNIDETQCVEKEKEKEKVAPLKIPIDKAVNTKEFLTDEGLDSWESF